VSGLKDEDEDDVMKKAEFGIMEKWENELCHS